MVRNLLETTSYALDRPRVAVSACLLGEPVRHDGAHRRDDYLLDSLSPHVDWVSVCPEVEMGMGVPREPIQIQSFADGVRLVGVNSRKDWSEASADLWTSLTRRLADEKISGFIFKSRSPSCGLGQVPHHDEDGKPTDTGSGVFAEQALRSFPYLPAVEEVDLRSEDDLQHWLVRVFAVHRLRQLLASPWTVRDFRAFHQREAFLLLAHSRQATARLEEVFVRIPATKRLEFAAAYSTGFLKIISRPPPRRRIAEALRRLAVCLSMTTQDDEIGDLELAISRYQRREVPLARPLEQISRLAGQGQIESILAQSFLSPFPRALLRPTDPSSCRF